MNQKNRTKVKNSTIKKELARLSSVECPDTTYIGHNFPTVFKKGKGLFLTDIENEKYLDFTSCFGVLALGHRPDVTVRTIRKQSAKLIHGMGDMYPSESKIKLLELLAKITPYTSPKSMLGLSGSDAVEIAMKTAVLATNRSKFISFDGAYHGVHLAPLNLNHTKHFTDNFKSLLTNHALFLPFPAFDENGSHLEKENTEHSDIVLTKLEDALKSNLYAALILEPIQGRGGIRIFTQKFLQDCQVLCKKYGTLLIFDEIMTGFGRTGKMFGYEHTNVVPDLMCLGKAMGGGLPLSACVGDMMDVWPKSHGEARHTQTFLGHPLACAVAYATILQIQKKLPEFQKELIQIDKEFDKFLLQSQNENLHKTNTCFVRGIGFMRGLWFYQRKGIAVELMEKLYSKKMLVLPEGAKNNVIALLPPLIATAQDYQKILAQINITCRE